MSLHQWLFEPLPAVQEVYDWLTSQSWYCGSLMWEHSLTYVFEVLLFGVFLLIELDVLPGKQYKIRKDHVPSASEIAKETWLSLGHLVTAHLLPLFVFDRFLYNPSLSYPATAPSIWTMLWKATAFIFLFDAITVYGHNISHYPISSGMKQGSKWMKSLEAFLRRQHFLHHKYRIVYAWNTENLSFFEGINTVICELIAMLPLAMDPVTRLFALLCFRYGFVEHHSGYDFPFMFHNWIPYGRYFLIGSVGHYYHHQNGKCNVGIFFAIFDFFNGTLHRERPRKDEFILRPMNPAKLKAY